MSATTLSRSRGAILLALSLGVLMAALDTSVVNLAVHRIGMALGGTVSALQWVVDAYNLFYAMLLLTGGTLGDLYGRKRLYLTGLGVFTVGSVACGLAPGIGVLIAARVIAGIGAALVLPCSLALVTVVWPDPEERAHALGLWAGCNGVAMAIGPTVGGVLIDTLGWRSIFLLIVPLGIAALLLSWRVVPESAAPKGRHLDLRGQVLGAVALGALALLAIEGPRWGWAAPTLACAVVCVAAALGFLHTERRAGTGAMLPLDLFRSVPFSGAFGVAAAMTFGMYGLLFLLPLGLQTVGGLSAFGTGLALLPMSVVFVLVSGRSGAWAARLGPRTMTTAGMALMGLGLLALLPATARLPLWWVEPVLAVIGVGLGLNTGPVVGVAVGAVTKARAGTAAALVNVARLVGATLGVAVLGAAYGWLARHGGAPLGLSVAFAAGGVVELAGAALAFGSINQRALQGE